MPTLYPGQGIATTTRAMAARSLILADEDAAATADWLVVSRRTAYWNAGLRARLAHGRKVAEESRQGVWLSAVYALPDGTNPEAPTPRERAQARSSSIVPKPPGHRGDSS